MLAYTYQNFPKLRGYIGFESGGFCEYPAAYSSVFYEKDERYKCPEDESGYFNHKCRGWYQLQKENPESSVLSDLYRDAGDFELVSTICVSLKEPTTNAFYGAMCVDIDVINDYFATHVDAHSHESGRDALHAVLQPTILQLDNPLSLSHLSESMLRAEREDWKLDPPFDAKLYGDIQINRGTFEVT